MSKDTKMSFIYITFMEVVEILFGNLLYKLLSFISFHYIIKSVVYEALMWKYQNNSYGSISFFFFITHLQFYRIHAFTIQLSNASLSK